MSRINSETGEFLLKNVFKDQLYLTLEKKFPDIEINWSNWLTKIEKYTTEDGKEKTKLEGCFDVTEIYDNSKLVGSIMRVAMRRFQAAMKFYSTEDSGYIPQEEMEKMLNGYEDLLGTDKVQKLIKDELENKQVIESSS